MKKISLNDPKLVQEFISTIKAGGLVVFPTETCYGAGVLAESKEAVTKLLNFKKRPAGKAISIACSDVKMAEKYVELNNEARGIYEKFLPGPVTVISKSLGVVDKRLESEFGTLGIRIPDYKILLQLISELGSAITSTSANLAGEKTPYSIQDIEDTASPERLNMIDLFIDAGELPRALPSTVIDTTTDELTTYRRGSLDFSSNNILTSIESHSVEETISFGEEIITTVLDGRTESNKILLMLSGELGAGKTHFTKGIAKSLGINRAIKSPTYSYIEEYRLENSNFKKLYHIDAWKISTSQELEALEFQELSKQDCIIVIEWPEIFVNKGYLDLFVNFIKRNIRISKIGESSRSIEIFEAK